jgi:DNA primase
MNVTVVMFPEGEDPDSFVRNNRTAVVEEFLDKEAKDFIQFKTNILLKETKNDPVKKAGMIKEIVDSISHIPDAIVRSVYIKECSSMMDMAEQTLMNELNKLLRKKFRTNFRDIPEEPVLQVDELPQEKQIQVDIHNTDYQEKDVIRLLLNYGPEEIEFEHKNEQGQKETMQIKVANFIINDLLSDEIIFNDPLYQRIFEEYAGFIEKDMVPNDKYFINHTSKTLASKAIDLLTSPYELSDKWLSKARIEVATEDQKIKVATVNAVLSLKAKKIEQLIAKNQAELQTAEKEERYEEMQELLSEQKELKEISRVIYNQLGRVITR